MWSIRGIAYDLSVCVRKDSIGIISYPPMETDIALFPTGQYFTRLLF